MHSFNKMLIVSLIFSAVNASAMRFLSSKMRSAAKMPIALASRILTKMNMSNDNSSCAARINMAPKTLKKWQDHYRQLQQDLITIKLADKEKLIQTIDDPCDFKYVIGIYKHKELGPVAHVDFRALLRAISLRREHLTRCLATLHGLKDIPNLEQHLPEYQALINKATNERNEMDTSIELLMGSDGRLPLASGIIRI